MVTEIERREQVSSRPAPTPAIGHPSPIDGEGAGGGSPLVGVDWFERYDTGGFYDEMFESAGQIRPHYQRLFAALAEFGPEEFRRRCGLADVSLMHQGITFTVYNDDRGVERPWPLDLIP